MKRVIKKYLICLFYTALNGSLNTIASIFYSNHAIKSRRKIPAKILILRTGSIGDSIVAFPAIVSVRNAFPNAEIDILTNSGSASFVGIEQILDKQYYTSIINYFGWSLFTLYKVLKPKRYDILINLSQDKTKWLHEFRRIIFFRACGIKSAIGFEIGTIPVFLEEQNRGKGHSSEKERLNKIVSKLFINIQPDQYPILASIDDEHFVRNILLENFTSNVKLISIVIGAKRVQNQWPINYWKELISACLHDDFKIAIVGSKDDALLSTSLHQNGVLDLCGKLTISQTAEVFKQSKLVISNDTGPMHLAYALNVPVIALFSAWQLANVWYPPKDKGVVLVDFSVPCALCYSHKCTNNVCMQKITPLDVLVKVKEIFNKHSYSALRLN